MESGEVVWAGKTSKEILADIKAFHHLEHLRGAFCPHENLLVHGPVIDLPEFGGFCKRQTRCLDCGVAGPLIPVVRPDK